MKWFGDELEFCRGEVFKPILEIKKAPGMPKLLHNAIGLAVKSMQILLFLSYYNHQSACAAIQMEQVHMP